MTTRVDGVNIKDGDITDAKLQTSINPSGAIDNNAFNIGVLGFKMAVNDGLTVFNLIDGVVDEFHDNTGIDTPENSNATYDATSDFYINQSGPNPVPAPQAERTSFTTVATTTYTVPATTTGINVLVVGGGGAGAGSNQYTQSGGGGAGGLTYLTNLPVTSGASIPLSVGSGGGLNPMNNPVTVSYTHLTLPTKRIV